MKHRDGLSTAPSVVSREDLADMGGPNLVYVREVPAADVVAEVETDAQGEAMFSFIKPDEGAIWYAVHAADGSRIAVLDDRDAAFAAARGHDLKPVSVH